MNNSTITLQIAIPDDGLEIIAKRMGWLEKVQQRDQQSGKIVAVDNPTGFEDHIKASLTRDFQTAYIQGRAALAGEQAAQDAAAGASTIAIT